MEERKNHKNKQRMTSIAGAILEKMMLKYCKIGCPQEERSFRREAEAC